MESTYAGKYSTLMCFHLTVFGFVLLWIIIHLGYITNLREKHKPKTSLWVNTSCVKEHVLLILGKYFGRFSRHFFCSSWILEHLKKKLHNDDMLIEPRCEKLWLKI
jgi:uncharacterized membrane protein